MNFKIIGCILICQAMHNKKNINMNNQTMNDQSKYNMNVNVNT